MGVPCERSRHKTKQKHKKLETTNYEQLKNYLNFGNKINENDNFYRATATNTTTTTTTSSTTTTKSIEEIRNVITEKLSQLIRFSISNGNKATITGSHYLVRHSLCFYAASSVILALCYLTTPVASEATHPM